MDTKRLLHSIGATTFILCYDVFKNNYASKTRNELATMLPARNPNLRSNDPNNSLPRIASFAIQLFRDDDPVAALEMCTKSTRLNPELVAMAQQLLTREKFWANVKDDLTPLDSRPAPTTIISDTSIQNPAPTPRTQISTFAYKRNPKVVAAVLKRANGKCECCGAPAPFIRRGGPMDGQPYLEVHHKQWLVEGGSDTVNNAVALCPNCHCNEHHGDRHYF